MEPGKYEWLGTDEQLHGGVKVWYLSPEELEKVRWGAKCDLEDRPNSIRYANWKWKRRRKKASNKR